MTVNKRTLRALVVLELIGLMRKKKKKWTRKTTNWIKTEKNSDIMETLCKNGRHRWVLGGDENRTC